MTDRILPVVLFLIAVGIFFGYINPTYTVKIAAHNQAIRGYDSALAAAKAFQQKESEIAEQKNAIPASGLARVTAFLPDGVDNVQLILDLNALANRSGLQLSNFDTIDSATNSKNDIGGDQILPVSVTDVSADSLEIALNAVGTYDAFKKFMAGAEASLRPLDLIDLQISDSATGIYNYSVRFRIYWFAPQ